MSDPTIQSWQTVTVYPDGSGEAGFYYERAMKHLAQQDASVIALRTFIAKHHDTLTGLSWMIHAYGSPELTMGCKGYRGKETTAREIALLWPGVVWKRKHDKYASGLAFSWVGNLDGIDLEISGAEKEDPRPPLRDGEIVDLSATEGGA